MHKTLIDHLWQTYWQRDRSNLLSLIATENLFASPIVDQPTLARIAQSIIDICWHWRWL